jgi:hypothetical protein
LTCAARWTTAPVEVVGKLNPSGRTRR